jgi:hypothetical protein
MRRCIVRARRDQLGVKIAFAVGNHGHLPSRGQRLACGRKTIKPAPRFLFVHRPLPAMLGYPLRSIDRDHSGEPENAAAVGSNGHNRMNEQAYVDAVSDPAKPAFAAAMLREVQFCRILDGKNVSVLGSASRMIGGSRDHFLCRYRRIMQEAAKPHLPTAPTTQPSDARRAPIDQRCEEISAPFFSRSSPNDPKFRSTSMGGPPESATHMESPHLADHQHPRIKCVHAVAPWGEDIAGVSADAVG